MTLFGDRRRSAGCPMRSCSRGSSAGGRGLVRGGVLGAGVAARPDGPGRLPPDAGRRPRRRRCLPGGVPRPGSQGPVGAGGRFARAMAPRGQRPGGAAGEGRRAGRTGPDAGPGRARSARRIRDEPTSSAGVDLRAAIDEEIARLPGRYRSAVVLCYLEGLTQEQAARRLRCPVGTIQSRLHRARERLRPALSRRGLAPPPGVRRRWHERTCPRRWPPRRPPGFDWRATRRPGWSRPPSPGWRHRRSGG